MVLKEQSAQYFPIQTTDNSNMTNLSNDGTNTDKTATNPIQKTKITNSFTMIIPQSVKSSAKKKTESLTTEDNADFPSSDSISSSKSMWKTFKRIQRSKKIDEVIETAEEKKMRFKAKKSVAVNSTTVDEMQEEKESDTNPLCKLPSSDSKNKVSPQIKVKKPFRAFLVRSMTDAEHYDSIEDIKTEMDELMKQRSWKNETNKGSKNKLNKQLVKTKKAWKSYEYEPGQLDYDKYYRMKEKHKEKMREKRRKEEVKTQSLDLEKYSVLENESKEDFVELAIKEREKKAEALIKQKLRRKKEKQKEVEDQNRDNHEFEDLGDNILRNDVLDSDSCIIDNEKKGSVTENEISYKDDESLHGPLKSLEKRIDDENIKEIKEKKDEIKTKTNSNKENESMEKRTVAKPQENKKRPKLARMKKIFEAKNNFNKALKRQDNVKSKENGESNEKEETIVKGELKKKKRTNLHVTENNEVIMENDKESLSGKESEINQGTSTNVEHGEETTNSTTSPSPVKETLQGDSEINDNETEIIVRETNNIQVRSYDRTTEISISTSTEKSSEAHSDEINLLKEDFNEKFCDTEIISEQIHELKSISVIDKNNEPIMEEKRDHNNEKLFPATINNGNDESHKNENDFSNNDKSNVETWILLTNGSEISDKIVEKCEQLTKWSNDRGLCDFYTHGENVSLFIAEWREKVAKIKRKKKVRFSL